MESKLLSMAQQFKGLPMEALIGGPLNAAATANQQMALTQTKFMLDTCFNKVVVEASEKIEGKSEERDETGVITQHEIIGTPAIDKHNEYRPIMIVMSLTRAVITPGTPGRAEVPASPAGVEPPTALIPAAPPTPPIITNMTTAFNLPMLTVVPLNSLAVETVDIGFEMEVKSSFAEDQEDTKEKKVHTEASFDASIDAGMFSVKVHGAASYDSTDKSTHATHYKKENSAKYTVNVHAGQLPLPQGVTTIIEAFTKSIDPITIKGPTS